MARKFRPLHPGMGQAVAERTILRKNSGVWETWGEVAERVAIGNTSLTRCRESEENQLADHIAMGRLLMSGRHLQHGDSSQITKNQECFTNCSTAMTSSLSFYLLLNGSGVGRAYDDGLMSLDWNKAPNIICILDPNHPDFDPFIHTTMEVALEVSEGKRWEFSPVGDSREGWFKSLEKWENITLEGECDLLILDFSQVRECGQPIQGMQGRPASGPGPLMEAFEQAQKICRKGWAPWKAAMCIDHVFAECVLVGGVRRSARIATKWWEDPGIHEFVDIKNSQKLWTANNSVAVDARFWEGVKEKEDKAYELFWHINTSSYKSGEPAYLNVDKLKQVRPENTHTPVIGSSNLCISETTNKHIQNLYTSALSKKNYHTVNPCSEISLALWGGFCVIADTAPFHCNTLPQVVDVFRHTTRTLIRTNLMKSVYDSEVKRTNRIGVGITGIHEFAWKFFKLGFRDLINEKVSEKFWSFIRACRDIIIQESEVYSKYVGLPTPHTMLTVKPSGTVSKLFGLTEGWHLPKKTKYLRWVQFKQDTDLVQTYVDAGYPVKVVPRYKGTVLIGFPTTTVIGTLDMGDKLVLASEATPEQQYEWLKLGEKNWLGENYGNQISYTLKYDPKKVSLQEFGDMILKHQPDIKCCSVLPDEDEDSLVENYGYVPEEVVSDEKFAAIVSAITVQKEDLDRVHLDCEGGSCPVDFKEGDKR